MQNFRPDSAVPAFAVAARSETAALASEPQLGDETEAQATETETTSGQRPEIRPLAGLRGIAALAVAMGHYHASGLSPLLSIFYWKNAAVDLFFCLSGFTLCLAYRAGDAERLSMRDYLVARIARIYPLYFLTLIAMGFVLSRPSIMTEHDRALVTGEFLRQVLMINAWSAFGNGIHWDFPAWSVSIEFFCYLFLFPGLFYAVAWLSRRKWSTRLVWSTLLMAASLYAYDHYYNQFIILFGRNPDAHLPETAFAVNLIRGVLGFSAGWIIYESYRSRDRLWQWVTRYADIVCLAVLGILIAGVTGLSSTQLMLLGFPLLVLGVSSGNSYAARFLSWGPIHYLGSISYSIYLLHIPWYYFGWLRAGLFGQVPTSKLSSGLVLIGGLFAVAVLSYHTVEVPLRRVIRGALQSRPARDQAAGRRQRAGGWVVAAAALMLFVVEGRRIDLFQPVPLPIVQPGEEITRYPVFEHVAGPGWSHREDWGFWAVGRDSYLTLRAGGTAGPGLRLRIKGGYFLTERHRSLTVRISVNDVEIGRFTPTFPDMTLDTELTLPAAAFSRDRTLRIRFQVDSPASPKSVGVSADDRVLGLNLTSMQLVAGASP